MGGRQNHHPAKAWMIDTDTFGLEETRKGRKRQLALRSAAPTLGNAGTAGTVEVGVVTMLVEAKATSVSTLVVAEVTSGVGTLRTSLIMLLREGTENTATDAPW
ncbi:hypothetical protein JG687_00017491 [Phytophthora cactorum]|uniref:Uncharacterized protein n=1 Tax=Phytophthora cactorum TaxID=29920 RepID=A0A329RXA7_9STRA|nr:hypothetical protein JG687_00017491 [Phytophthora cactorum]RAW28196.1 hypothetical protein PC110_g15407 [Phytophthora cactorum]